MSEPGPLITKRTVLLAVIWLAAVFVVSSLVPFLGRAASAAGRPSVLRDVRLVNGADRSLEFVVVDLERGVVVRRGRIRAGEESTFRISRGTRRSRTGRRSF